MQPFLKLFYLSKGIFCTDRSINVADDSLFTVEVDYRLCALVVLIHAHLELFNGVIPALLQRTAAYIADAFHPGRLVLDVIDCLALRTDPSGL